LIGQLREALWAVRILDRWAARDPVSHCWFVKPRVGYLYCWLSVTFTPSHDVGRRSWGTPHFGPDENSARIAAAKALVAEDPTLEPQEIKL
jgi:hypothetical protein